MFLTMLMQQHAGESGDLRHEPSGIPQVVSSSQLDKEKCKNACCFKLFYHWGIGKVLATSFLRMEALNLGSGNRG